MGKEGTLANCQPYCLPLAWASGWKTVTMLREFSWLAQIRLPNRLTPILLLLHFLATLHYLHALNHSQHLLHIAFSFFSHVLFSIIRSLSPGKVYSLRFFSDLICLKVENRKKKILKSKDVQFLPNRNFEHFMPCSYWVVTSYGVPAFLQRPFGRSLSQLIWSIAQHIWELGIISEGC